MTDWRARFEAFCARKEAEARAAAIDPFVPDGPVTIPGGTSCRAIGNAWSRAMFGGDFYVADPPDATLPATSLVFVQSKDRNTGAKNPSTLGGGEADKHLIYEGLSRVAADGVLAGAATVRGGDILLSTWHPEIVALRRDLGLPRHPTQIVATLKGMPLEDGLIFNVPDVPVILITVRSCATAMREPLAARPWITPVMLPDPGAVRNAFVELRRLAVRTVSCIGGRTLARQLIDDGLIQDLYLTTSARLGGEPNTPVYPGEISSRTILVRRGTGRDAGVTFQHLRLEMKS